jgi:hypothetical protein
MIKSLSEEISSMYSEIKSSNEEKIIILNQEMALKQEIHVVRLVLFEEVLNKVPVPEPGPLYSSYLECRHIRQMEPDWKILLCEKLDMLTARFHLGFDNLTGRIDSLDRRIDNLTHRIDTKDKERARIIKSLKQPISDRDESPNSPPGMNDC